MKPLLDCLACSTDFLLLFGQLHLLVFLTSALYRCTVHYSEGKEAMQSFHTLYFGNLLFMPRPTIQRM